MKRVVSISLGSPTRDKCVDIQLKGKQLRVERIGTGGDARKARQLFAELDGQADVLTVGGIDLYVRLGDREYPIRSAHKLVEDVRQTPVVDGHLLKYVLERRVFQNARQIFGGSPDFNCALVPSGIDRIGLLEAVTQVCGTVYVGDLYFMLDIPVMIHGLNRFRKIAQAILPLAGYFPVQWILPPGSKEEDPKPKALRYWQLADLIAGDMHYIRKYGPDNLQGKTVITNTTTLENIQLLVRRGVQKVVTTTPCYEGRTFGVNVMEGILTAYSDKNELLTAREMDDLIDELEFLPTLLYDQDAVAAVF